MRLNISRFFKNAIYLPYDRERPARSTFNKIIRILYFSVAAFIRNECILKSSLLTFYALISIVPLLAIFFAIAKGFGLEEFLQNQILLTFKEQGAVIPTAMRFAYAFLAHIKSQTIIGIGVLFLFFSVFGLFESIEESLNTIWNVKKHRGFLRRSANYITLLIIFPVFFVASTSITIFINSVILNKIQNYVFLQHFSSYAFLFLKLAPFILMCMLFIFIYIYTPNSKVYFKLRIFSGILAGALFQFWQIIYIDFQVYISSYNVVYGSFAALPLFLIWMQVNFVIFLFGAEIAAQAENDRFFKKTSREDSFKMITQKQLAFLVLHEITGHFLKGEGPFSIEHISKHLGISLLDARESLNILEKAGMIAEITSWRRSLEQYQLIINPELFTVQHVSDLLDQHLLRQARSKLTNSLRAVQHSSEIFKKTIKDSGTDLNLKDFANLKPDLST